jgi:hypothetical protein
MDFTTWYTSVAGVVMVTILAVSVLKRAFGNVAYVNTVPTWLYAVAISAGLTALTNYVWHTLPGNLWQNMMQAVMMAGSASGFYEWLNAPGKPLASSAISAGVLVDLKNTPDRVDLATVAPPPPKTLTALVLAVALSSASCAGQPPPNAPTPRRVAVVSVATAHAVLGALQDGERALVCDTAGAPAPPLCVNQTTHRRISGELAKAFDLDIAMIRLVRDLPAGAPFPADVPKLIADIAVAIDRIVALIPPSALRDRLTGQLRQIGGLP